MFHSLFNGLIPAGHCSRLMIPANDRQLKYDRPVVLWAKRSVLCALIRYRRQCAKTIPARKLFPNDATSLYSPISPPSTLITLD